MIAIMSELEHHFRDLRGQEHIFEAGQYVFHLGDAARIMHFVHGGMVHLIRNQTDGFVLVLQKAGAGSILAEASLYSDRYHCDAVASVTTHSVAFTKFDLQAHLRDRPAFAEAWARHLAHELQKTRMQAEILCLKTVTRRLDAWIAYGDRGLPRKGEWKTLASELGVSPEALYREMARRRPSGS
jgi:CRP-like cAMP-binding protein